METIYAAVPAVVAGSFLALREAWRAWQPARHLLAGRYEEAALAGEKLSRSWMRGLPGVRFSAEYAIACARHLAGDLEGSLAATSSLERGRYEVRSLDAASLVLLDRSDADAERVLELLDGLDGRIDEDFLLEAIARHRLGREDAALRKKVTASLTTPAPRGERAAIFHFLRGLYYSRARNLEHLAKEDLTLAADGAHANVYTRRARAMLDERPGDEGPSSLAPQVVTKPAP